MRSIYDRFSESEMAAYREGQADALKFRANQGGIYQELFKAETATHQIFVGPKILMPQGKGKDMKIATITAPAYWNTALINNDRSGLSESESAMLDRWLAREGLTASQFVDCEEESRFTWQYRLYCPEADCAGGDVLEYTYIEKESAR